jgi:hypothetical protein
VRKLIPALYVAALLFPLVIHAAEEGGPSTQQSQMAKTDPVIAVFAIPGETQAMGSVVVKVPHVTGAFPVLCFKYPSEQHLNCFYVNSVNGLVKVIPVMSNMVTL